MPSLSKNAEILFIYFIYNAVYCLPLIYFLSYFIFWYGFNYTHTISRAQISEGAISCELEYASNSFFFKKKVHPLPENLVGKYEETTFYYKKPLILIFTYLIFYYYWIFYGLTSGHL